MASVCQQSLESLLPSLADAPDVLTERQIRAIFAIPHATLTLSISQGHFPAPIRISKSSKRWLKADLIRFIEAQREPARDIADVNDEEDR